MSDNTETTTPNEQTSDGGTSTSSFGHVNAATPVRLFGQFKQNGTAFNSFGQFSANEETPAASTSYFTSTISKLSSNNGGGFGSSSASLAASLAPLSANKEVFGESTTGAVTSSSADTVITKEEENGGGGDDDEDENNDEDDKTTPSLLEKAAEYEAKRAFTHPSANIQGDTSTGEEHEITKFQMAGKLFMYNSDQQQFVERGYGILKINESHDPSDWNKLQARLIMRLDKAFRVILNSPIFSTMTVERASDRSVRFGAQDESHLRVFVIKALSSDCANLCKELQSRIQIIERQQAAVASASNLQSSTKQNPSSSNSSPTNNSSTRIRKRSHSKSESDTSDHTNDLSKKSKLIEGYRDGNKDTSDDDDSVESTKTGEQETIS